MKKSNKYETHERKYVMKNVSTRSVHTVTQSTPSMRSFRWNELSYVFLRALTPKSFIVITWQWAVVLCPEWRRTCPNTSV